MKHAAAWALAALGTVHMIGYFADSTPIKGLAAATVASPAPKVFSAVVVPGPGPVERRTLETYSTDFVLEWTDAHGEPHALEITRDVYARLEGPYNRRNVYGAVLAFGPALVSSEAARPMFESVLRHAACGDRPLLAELGVEASTVRDPVIVRVVPPEGVELDLPLALEAPCR